MAWGSGGLGERLKNRCFRSSTLGIRVACGVLLGFRVKGLGLGGFLFFLGGGGGVCSGLGFPVCGLNPEKPSKP